MEYIDGRDLSELANDASERGLQIPPSAIAQVIRDAALALRYAHAAVDADGKPLHLIHRDISPHNLMVREDGVTKVVDFGVARATNRQGRTRTGIIKGKFAYLSPEQARAERLDPRSDQFSLGIVLWELLARRRLFKADNEIETLQKVLQDPIPKPSQFAPETPLALEMIAMRALERDREARFPDTGAMADALGVYLKSLPGDQGLGAVTAFLQKLPRARRPSAPGSDETVPDLGRGVQTVPGSPGRRRHLAAVVGLGGLFILAAVWRLTTSHAPSSSMTVPVPAPAPAAVLAAPAPIPPEVVTPPTRGSLVVASEPPGAELALDGTPRGKTPLTLRELSAGRHHGVVSLSGYATQPLVITVRPGATSKERVILRPATLVPPHPP
jgi:serine/threonine protein kinase